MLAASLPQCTQDNLASNVIARHRRQAALLWRPPLRPLVVSAVLLCLVGLVLVTPLQAQTTPGGTPTTTQGTPEDAFGDAIYGPNRMGNTTQSTCFRLNQIPGSRRSAGTQDLVTRCNELASTQSDAALRQVAGEEVATQGTNAVETSNKNIGARLAALRAGATGIRLGGLALDFLDFNQYRLPSTLVAGLGPYAAVSSAGAAETPGLFKKLGLFVNGNLSLGEKDATRKEDGFDFKTYGVTAGADYRFTRNIVLGGAFNFQSTDSDLADTRTVGFATPVDGGSVDSTSYSGSIYATYYVTGMFYVDGIFTFGWNDYDIARSIVYNVGTAVQQTVEADTNGTQLSFSLGGGYDFNVAGWTLSPLVRVNYLKLDIDGYREDIDNTNPGFGWALAFADQDVESLTTVLGGQVSYAISTGVGVLLPQVRFEWEHEFLNDSQTLTARFVNDPQRAPIRFTTDNPDRNFFNIGVGLSATFREGMAAFVYYETVLGLEDVTRHTVVLGVRKEF
jgi:outer membrane lipase/esterase